MRVMEQFNEAVTFAQSHEIPWPRDPTADLAHWGVHHDDPPPFNRVRGPVHPRGGVSGVIRVRGAEVAAWGEPDRADQTFSVAKTYLALLAGIAHARGLLEVGERVSDRLPGIGFDSAHNRVITWEHLLTQTSEWQGECFGMPDQVEHYRHVSHDPKPAAGKKGELRPLHEPGSYWEYNDVRINQLSLALLHLFKRPLPEVFLESVLRPIGGGRDFQWEGYDDAWVEIDGQRMQSVPGGTHWGGGVKISARDQARIGQLLLDGGAHQGRQVIPRDWVQRMHEPYAGAPFYGWLTWLNRDGRLFADASHASWFMFGAGGHMVWIDPDNEAVVVARWLDGAHSADFVRRVAQALRHTIATTASLSTVVGVLLAAGLGKRYDPSGESLKLLQTMQSGPHAGLSIAVAAARNLKAAVQCVVAVVRPLHDPHQVQLHDQLQKEGCELVPCTDAANGMGASIACGIRACADADGWLIALADMPSIKPATIKFVVNAIRAGHTTAAPAYQGQRGHPVGFSVQCLPYLLRSSGDRGASAVLDTFAPHLIEVDDDGVLIDIDYRV